MIGALVAWLLSMGPVCLIPPVNAPVADPFREPTCAYCVGHRGIEYDTVPGQRVVAAAGGTVTFVGVVAGTRYVVIRHADGMLATYGQLTSTALRSTGVVQAGHVVGSVGEQFYFGVRLDGRYVDPASWLGVLRSRPRLVPSDNRPARPAPAARLACASAPSGR